MKKILSIFTIAVVFTACKSKTDLNANKNMVLVDTTGLSKSNVLTDVGNNKFVINDKVVTKPVSDKPVKSNTGSTVNNAASNNNTNANNTSSSPAPVKRDKGWSDAAKGTAIGAGSGAVLGAVVAKNDRGKGAVIGSVIGAGTGYIIGRSRDKKSGRVARSKARRTANQ